jgi:hypothetical protein
MGGGSVIIDTTASVIHMRPALLKLRTPILALGCCLLSVPQANAQYVVNIDRMSPATRNFEWRPDDKPLNCSVSAIRPSLNFGFRFQAGYTVRVPMNQYRGPGHRWTVLMRVTPQDGTPVYFASRYRLPDVPKTSNEVEVGGGYLLGEGRYAVSWKMTDDAGRVCRKEWRVEAKRSHGEGKVKVAMAPNTVNSFSSWTVGRGNTDDAPPIRLTVLMHAAPNSPRRMRMAARDRILLLGTLSALLERLPTSSVRLVVFNLDLQRELYRQENFATSGFNDVAQSLDGLELGLVDYHVLQNRRGHVDLLADMVNQEVNAPQPSDVVLFLGPMARYVDRMPDSVLEKPPGSTPKFFYFQYRPMMRMESTLPDVIHSAVSRLKGKTVIIHSPGDFAKGIDQVERLH